MNKKTKKTLNNYFGFNNENEKEEKPIFEDNKEDNKPLFENNKENEKEEKPLLDNNKPLLDDNKEEEKPLFEDNKGEKEKPQKNLTDRMKRRMGF